MGTGKRLKNPAEWQDGTVAEFLALSPEESLYVEMKAALAVRLHHRRAELQLTQTEVARMLGSGQSRVAKMEKAESSVSIDLLIRSLLALGADRNEIARVIQG
ncbi:MAG: XRE family transcriptional regulator [Bacteroidetes bacterium]|nr:XRE family transcriptional regulator [Bacteroidota bacterium]